MNREAGPTATMLVALAISVVVGLATPLAAQTSAGAHVVRVDPDPTGEAVTTVFLHGRLDRAGRWGGWDWTAAGTVWLDAGEIDASVLAPAELSLARRGDRWGVRAGVGEVAWGLSELRSPAALLRPVGLLWNSVTAPPVGNPFVEVSTRVGGAEVEAVLLPVRPPLQPGRLVDVTWDGRRLDAPAGWEAEAGYGLRIWRSFEALDLGVWWMDARDRRPWIAASTPGSPGTPPPADDEEARVRHPRTRQLGGSVEWVLGPTVIRGEAALARRDEAWHSRGVAGVDWFATPWLTLQLEQGLASDRDEAASPLVDDALLGVQLITETLRFRGGLAVDPESGTRHAWSTLRWTATERGSLEVEWVEAWGDRDAESSSALRQPRALRIAGIWYF